MTDKISMIEKFLKCPQCLQYFDTENHSPVVLPCLHTFCQICVSSITAKDATVCPDCQETFHNTDHFPVDKSRKHLVDYHKIVNREEEVACDQCKERESSGKCRECDEFLCHNCIDAHSMTKLTKHHKVTSLKTLKTSSLDAFHKKQTCQVKGHEGQQYSFFCDSIPCRVPVCTLCVLTTHTDSKGHDVRNLNDVYVEHKRRLENELADIKKLTLSTSEETKNIRQNITHCSTLETKTVGEIEDAFQSFVKLLETRKEKLKRELKDHTKRLRGTLTEKLEATKNLVERSKLASDFTSFLVAYSDATELLELKDTVKSRIEGLSIENRKAMDDKNVPSDVKFVKSKMEDAMSNSDSFGELLTKAFYAESTRVETFLVMPGKERQTVATITLQDQTGNIVHESGASIIAEIKANGFKHFHSVVKDCSLTEGCYKVLAGPLRQGMYLLNVTVEGRMTSKEPYAFSVSKATATTIPSISINDSTTSSRTHNSSRNIVTSSRTPNSSRTIYTPRYADTSDDHTSLKSGNLDNDLEIEKSEIECPEIHLSADHCHVQNVVADDQKSITNKKHRRYSARSTPNCLQNYRGTLATKPLNRIGRVYFEVQMHLFVKRVLRTDLVFEVGLSRKSVIDQTYSIDGNPHAWAICFRRCAICRSICLQAWHNHHKLYHTPIADMCPPGTTIKNVYGFLLDNESNQWIIMDVKSRRLLFRFKDVTNTRALWPVIGVYSPDFVEVSLTVKSADEIQTTLEPYKCTSSRSEY